MHALKFLFFNRNITAIGPKLLLGANKGSIFFIKVNNIRQNIDR